MTNSSDLLQAAKYAFYTEKQYERAEILAQKIISDFPDSADFAHADKLLREISEALPALYAERNSNEVERQKILEERRSKTPKTFLLLSTTDEIDGFRTVKNLGVVRGSSVRARHIGSDMAASLKSIVGGELKGVTQLIDEGREQAFGRMCREADSLGANAIKGLRFSTSNVWEGAAEVMAYGTAVFAEPAEKKSG